MIEQKNSYKHEELLECAKGKYVWRGKCPITKYWHADV